MQDIDVYTGKVVNVVDMSPKKLFGLKDVSFRIVVNGEITPLNQLPQECSNNANYVGVTFTSFQLGKFSIPLPRPKGTLLTTYCDSVMRLSRGGKGGLFVVQRVPPR